MRFDNRSQAGKLLADRLLQYREKNCIVIALPRGGVPVGHEIAGELSHFKKTKGCQIHPAPDALFVSPDQSW